MTSSIILDMQQLLFSVLYMGKTTGIGRNCFNKRKSIALNFYTMWLKFTLQFKIKGTVMQI